MSIGNLLPFIILGNKSSQKAKNAAILQVLGGKSAQAKLISDVSTFTALKEIDKSNKDSQTLVTDLNRDVKQLEDVAAKVENVSVKMMEIAFKSSKEDTSFDNIKAKAAFKNLQKVEMLENVNAEVIYTKLKEAGVAEKDIKNLKEDENDPDDPNDPG